MAMAMFRLITFTFVASIICYAAGFALRKFVPRYKDFQYRLSIPIVACCFGAIAALLLTTELMSLFLVDALYHFDIVRRYPAFIIGALDVAAYALGGYYATKYSVRFAHKLDMRRTTKNDQKKLRSAP
jgi:hypothetical protein